MRNATFSLAEAGWSQHREYQVRRWELTVSVSSERGFTANGMVAARGEKDRDGEDESQLRG
jgi:hypothetical protein